MDAEKPTPVLTLLSGQRDPSQSSFEAMENAVNHLDEETRHVVVVMMNADGVADIFTSGDTPEYVTGLLYRAAMAVDRDAREDWARSRGGQDPA